MEVFQIKTNNMANKLIFSLILFILSGAIIWKFALPLNEQVIIPMQDELTNLQDGYDRAAKQLTIEGLRQKKNKISGRQQELLKTYIPEELHSGKLVYNLAGTALQNRLVMKNIQYSVVDMDKSKGEEFNKKLNIEFQIEGNYLDFINWMSLIEKADVLIDTESVRGNKINNVSDRITWTVKMSAYGLSIL
jgi:Tfp pilus assembly protein PilO